MSSQLESFLVYLGYSCLVLLCSCPPNLSLSSCTKDTLVLSSCAHVLPIWVFSRVLRILLSCPLVLMSSHVPIKVFPRVLWILLSFNLPVIALCFLWGPGIFVYCSPLFLQSHKVHTYKEYHRVCTLVGIGTLLSLLSPASVPLPPEPKGWGGTLACGWGVGGVPILTIGEKVNTLRLLFVQSYCPLYFLTLFEFVVLCSGLVNRPLNFQIFFPTTIFWDLLDWSSSLKTTGPHAQLSSTEARTGPQELTQRRHLVGLT